MIHTIAFLICVSAACAFSTSFVNRALLARHKTSILRAVPKHKVTINIGDVSHVLEVAEDETILDASLDAGIDLPYDCKCGVCLTCPCKVVSGTVNQDGSTLDDSVMEDGYGLTCMCYPRSEIVMKTIEEQELLDVQFGDNTSWRK